MPAWWPQGESWPPKPPAPARRDAPSFPIGIVLLFALLVNLVAAVIVMIVWPFTSAIAWPYAWPLGAMLLIVATAGLFVLAMRWIGAPLGDIVAAAQQVGSGNLSVRVDEQGIPWLRSVASAFNTMTARLERQQQERRALMSDIAHELRTPLSVIQGRVEGMLDGVYPRDEAHVRQVLEETRTLSRLVEDLRTSAHAESGTLQLQTEPTDLGVLVEDAASAFSPDADARRVRIDVRLPSDAPLLEIDPHRIREVLGNLLSNALRYSPAGGVVTIECSHDPEAVVTRVMDEGPGIRTGDLSRVFERFYKSPTSKGSGLGLAIAKGLVTAHGGTIVAVNREGGGTTIRFTLPVDRP